MSSSEKSEFFKAVKKANDSLRCKFLDERKIYAGNCSPQGGECLE